MLKHIVHAAPCMVCLKWFVSTCCWQPVANTCHIQAAIVPQVFQTFKWLLTTEQQARVATWVKKAVAATFNGTAPACAEGMPAASSSSSGSKAQKAKLEAETAAVMNIFGN